MIPSISIKKNNSLLSVHALDVSEEALKVAKLNAQLNEVAINFLHQSVFNETRHLKM